MLWLYITLGVLLFLVILLFINANILFNIACRRSTKPLFTADERKIPEEMRQLQAVISENMARVRGYEMERVEITSFDGLRLVGHFYPYDGSENTIICCHGFRSNPYYDFSSAVDLYHSLGYNLLLIEERAHGESEGKYLGYGVLERFDCRDWARFVNARFEGRGSVFLSGISMGCATVLMSSVLGQPENVRGIIADCGFTGPAAIIGDVMTRLMHLPKFLFLPPASLVCRIRAHYSFYGCTTIDAMKENKIPVLFVHGEADSFVPIEMTRLNYAACTAEKTLLTVPGAEHGMSFLTDTERCTKALTTFLRAHTPVES